MQEIGARASQVMRMCVPSAADLLHLCIPSQVNSDSGGTTTPRAR
jgi:hypothetical protein